MDNFIKRLLRGIWPLIGYTFFKSELYRYSRRCFRIVVLISNDIQERIRARVYELFEERGGENGHDVADWLQAEAEFLSTRQPIAA